MSDPVIGGAFVEVHARASADLDREVASAVNNATAKASAGSAATQGSVAEARQQLALWKKDLENVDTTDLAKVQELTEGAAGWQETLTERTKLTGVGMDDLGRKGTAALGGIGAAASVAGPILLGLAGAAAAAVAAFQDQALKGMFGEEGRAEAEAFAGEMKELQGVAVDLTAAVGAGLVPALTDTLEVANALLGPLADNGEAITAVTKAAIGVVSPLTGVISAYKDWRGETREASEAIEGLTDSVSLLTLAQERNRVETERSAESQKKAADEYDRRIGATVTAVEADLQRASAMTRIAEAQQELADAQQEVNDVQGRSARAAERVTDALRAQRDAIQAVADANQNVIEADERVEKIRRKLAEAEFRMGTGSRDALDARGELNAAEYDASRAREEAVDSLEDARKAEADVARARQQEAKEALEANQRLQEAHRQLDEAVRASARNEADYEIALRESRGETVSAKDQLEIYRQKLLDVANNAGPAIRKEIDNIRRALDSLPSQKSIEIVLNTEAALAGLSEFAKQVPDAVGLALTDIATGAPLAGTDPNSRPAATTAPTVTGQGGVNVQQYVTQTSDPVQLSHELQWTYQP